MTECERLARPAGAVHKTEQSNPDLSVPGVGGRPELDLDRSLLDPRLLHKAVEADLVEFVDAVGGDRVECPLEQPPHALLDSDEDQLRRGIRQEGERGDLAEAMPPHVLRPPG